MHIYGLSLVFTNSILICDKNVKGIDSRLCEVLAFYGDFWWEIMEILEYLNNFGIIGKFLE